MQWIKVGRICWWLIYQWWVFGGGWSELKLTLFQEYYTWQNPDKPGQFSYCQYPFILSIVAKRHILTKVGESVMKSAISLLSFKLGISQFILVSNTTVYLLRQQYHCSIIASAIFLLYYNVSIWLLSWYASNISLYLLCQQYHCSIILSAIPLLTYHVSNITVYLLCWQYHCSYIM